MVEILSNQFDLTDGERNQFLPLGSNTVVENRIGWAKTYLKKVVFIESKM